MWYRITGRGIEVLVLVVGGRIAVCQGHVFPIGHLESTMIEDCKRRGYRIDYASQVAP